jgi:hypothetical protein
MRMMRSFEIPRIVDDPIMALHGVKPRIHRDFVNRPRPGSMATAETRRAIPMPREHPAFEPRLSDLNRIRTFIPEGLSEGETPGFWSNIASALSTTISSAIPSLAAVQVAKLQANQTASLLQTQAKLYTPQNLATLQNQGAFEAAQRANMAAAAAGSTTPPITTGTMIALGVAALGGIWLLTRKK